MPANGCRLYWQLGYRCEGVFAGFNVIMMIDHSGKQCSNVKPRNEANLIHCGAFIYKVVSHTESETSAIRCVSDVSIESMQVSSTGGRSAMLPSTPLSDVRKFSVAAKPGVHLVWRLTVSAAIPFLLSLKAVRINDLALAASAEVAASMPARG